MSEKLKKIHDFSEMFMSRVAKNSNTTGKLKMNAVSTCRQQIATELKVLTQ